MKTNWMSLGKKGWMVFVLFLFVNVLNAQETFVLVSSKSELTVKGTSSLHDWHMAAGLFSGSFEGGLNTNTDLEINNVSIECKAASIKSDNSIMDDKAHDALKVKKHETISFTSKQPLAVIVNGGTLNSKVGGALSIAGEAKNISIPFKGEVDTEGNVKVKGTLVLKMSDFNMKAPTALMGTIKTGDEVVVDYTFYFQKK